VLHALSDLAGRFGVPTVAVHPVYTIAPEHRSRLRLLAAIDHNCRLEEVPVRALPDGGDETIDLHWLGPEALAARYARWPDALAQSDAIAARCGPALPDGRPIWPAVPPTYRNLAGNDKPDPDAILARLAREGVRERYGHQPDDAILQRLDRELAAITRHGYAPLFLAVADIVRYAREQGIAVSTRGSVANSLVAYAIRITTVDPIAHDLLFKRFLNPARQDQPDIDLDFDSRRRDEVLDYVRRTYGEDRVALVCTVSLMRPRSAFRETAKALGLDETSIKPVLKLLPRSFHPGSRRKRRTLDEIAEGSDLDGLPRAEALKTALRLADGITGAPHHLSVHPGGTVITPAPVPD
jgi:DNA polymerase III alpha subunit